MIATINMRRLWLLLSIIWGSSILVYYYKPVTQNIEIFLREESFRIISEREALFRSCLKDIGTSWAELEAKFRSSCIEKVEADCSGGFAWECNKDYWFNSCIASKSKEPCYSMKFHEIGSQEFRESLEALSYKNKFIDFLHASIRFVSGKHGKSFNLAILLFTLGPVFFAILPRTARFGWRWLTSTK